MAAANSTRKPLAWATTRGSVIANSFKVSRQTCESRQVADNMWNVPLVRYVAISVNYSHFQRACTLTGATSDNGTRYTPRDISNNDLTYPSEVVLFVTGDRHHCAHHLSRKPRRVNRYYLLDQFKCLVRTCATNRARYDSCRFLLGLGGVVMQSLHDNQSSQRLSRAVHQYEI